MLACRKWGQRQTGCYYLCIPSGVLLLPANNLRFGAVPHLFAPHTRPPPRRRPRICEDGFRSDIDSRNPFLPVEHLTVRELRHTTEGANRVECSFSPDLRPAANGRPSTSVTQRRPPMRFAGTLVLPLRINRRCGNQSALGNFRARVA